MYNKKQLYLALIVYMSIFAATPALATLEQQKNMLDQLDQLDHQEFLALTENAYSCIQSRNFGCAESKLTKAGKYLTNPQDRKTLNIARKDLAAERRYEKEELAAVAELERQAQLARQRAAEAEVERQRREKRAQQEASNDDLVKGVFAAGTGVFVGRVTKNANLGVAAAKLVYTGDTEGFNAAVDQAKAEREQAYNAKMAAIRAEKAERDAERQRNAKIERDKRANAERTAKIERDNRADAQRAADTRLAQENTRIRQQEQERLQKQARLQEQSQLKEQERQQEQERKQEQARKKAEAEKTKLAEQQAEKQASAQYLKSIAAGTRLVATKCPDGEGKYYATGTRPRIKPEVVSCVDVRFRAYCPGDVRQYSEGTAHNFIGMSGCFGDTYDINPKPGCKVDQVRIEVVEARECSK